MFPAMEGREQNKGLKATATEEPDLGPGNGDQSTLRQEPELGSQHF